MQGPASVLEDGEVRRSSKRRDSTSGIKKKYKHYILVQHTAHTHMHIQL